jgi:hypothetical protein
VGEPAVFMHAAPSMPGPAFRQAKMVGVWGQQVWVDGHSQGFSLQGVAPEPPSPPVLLLLEQAVARSARRRRARLDMGWL